MDEFLTASLDNINQVIVSGPVEPDKDDLSDLRVSVEELLCQHFGLTEGMLVTL